MPGTSIFANPFQVNPVNVRPPQRPDLVSGAGEGEREFSQPPDPSPFSSGNKSQPFLAASLPPGEYEQYKLAGIEPNEELPGGNFPHARLKDVEDSARLFSSRQLEGQLSELNLSRHSLSRNNQEDEDASFVGQKKPIVKNLATILHVSLLRGDFERAGRVWAMLLRMDYGVRRRPMDIRSSGLWSLGAEILLRRRAPNTASDAAMGRDMVDGNAAEAQGKANGSRATFSRERLEEAKKYYERLGAQFPHYSFLPDTIGPLQFYSAMVGLWIYHVHEQHKLSLEEVRRDDEDIEMDEDARAYEEQREREVYATTIHGARAIAGYLDDHLKTSTFEKDAESWRLRGDVAKWIINLCEPRMSELRQMSGSDGDDSESASNADIPHSQFAWLVNDEREILETAIERYQELSADASNSRMK